uniref:Uncharacterized protein n=1 Tax=viral metagenome TaxID=1070528 RepID=A0A6C0CJ12_9ZZZZ
MDLLKTLGDGQPLAGIEQADFSKILGELEGAERLPDFFFWRQNYSIDHYGYHFLYQEGKQWMIKTFIFGPSSQLEGYKYAVRQLRELGVRLFQPLMSMPSLTKSASIFPSGGKLEEEKRVFAFFEKSGLYADFLKGQPNQNTMSFGVRHNCGPFSIKFMPNPAFPIKVITFGQQPQKPENVFQAVCGTCKQCFMATHGFTFERQGPLRWDPDWQLAVQVAIRAYNEHRDYCSGDQVKKRYYPDQKHLWGPPEATKVEILRHEKEATLYTAYRKADFAYRKNRTAAHKITRDGARLAYNFSRLSDVNSSQLGEIFDSR